MWRSTSSLFESSAIQTRFGLAPDEADDAESVRRVRQRRRTRRQREGNNQFPKLGSFEVMNRTIDIAQAALARHTPLAAYPPDLLIEATRSACRSLEFHRAAEVIDIGHELTAQAVKTLEG